MLKATVDISWFHLYPLVRIFFHASLNKNFGIGAVKTSHKQNVDYLNTVGLKRAQSYLHKSLYVIFVIQKQRFNFPVNLFSESPAVIRNKKCIWVNEMTNIYKDLCYLVIYLYNVYSIGIICGVKNKVFTTVNFS